MNIQHHIYAIKEIISRYDIPDRNSLTNSLIEHFLNVERSNLLGDMQRRKIAISSLNYSTLCVELELTKVDDCNPDCYILRSKYKLPKYIGKPIVRVGNTQISNLNIFTIKNAKKSLHKKDQIGFYIQDNYLYVYNNVSLEKVSVLALYFSNNLKSILDVDCDCNACIEEYDFIIDSSLIDTLYTLVIKRIIATYANKETQPKSN